MSTTAVSTVAAAPLRRCVSTSAAASLICRRGTSPESRTKVPRSALEQRLGLLQGVGGSQLRLLKGKPKIGRAASGLRTVIGAVADDHRTVVGAIACGLCGGRGRQRAPRNGCRTFGKCGLHACALAGGENHDVEYQRALCPSAHREHRRIAEHAPGRAAPDFINRFVATILAAFDSGIDISARACIDAPSQAD